MTLCQTESKELIFCKWDCEKKKATHNFLILTESSIRICRRPTWKYDKRKPQNSFLHMKCGSIKGKQGNPLTAKIA
jgi:hypothetical protein